MAGLTEEFSDWEFIDWSEFINHETTPENDFSDEITNNEGTQQSPHVGETAPTVENHQNEDKEVNRENTTEKSSSMGQVDLKGLLENHKVWNEHLRKLANLLGLLLGVFHLIGGVCYGVLCMLLCKIHVTELTEVQTEMCEICHVSFHTFFDKIVNENWTYI